MKSNRRVVSVCDWQTSYSKSEHGCVLDGGAGKRPSIVQEEERGALVGRPAHHFNMQPIREKGRWKEEGGLRWMRLFHFIHAEQFQFYSSAQFPILSSLLIPSLSAISLTNQSKNYRLEEEELQMCR
jgi:hypothetical protein